MAALLKKIPVAHDLLLLRHGETEWNRAGQLQGKKNSPLTDKGRSQARRQAKVLRRIRPSLAQHTLFASPLGRAQETARLAFEGDPFITDDRLAEIGLGRWEGTTRNACLDSDPDLASTVKNDFDFYVNAPDGEGLAALSERIAAFLGELKAPAVIVSHKVTLSVMHALLTGQEGMLSCDLAPPQGSVLQFRRNKVSLHM